MRRRTKIVVATAVVAASAIVVLWNTSATSGPESLGVADAKREAAAAPEKAVHVRGAVQEGSIVEDGPRVVSFVLADSEEQLRVVYNQTPPDNFGPKEVIVKGTIRSDPDGTLVLHATAIQVGCASKY